MPNACKLFSILFCAVLVSVFASFSFAQSKPPIAKGPKLCVAQSANSSNQPVFADDIKTSLYQSMLQAGLNADDTPTATMLASKLDMSYKNEFVAKRLHCDYVLLSEIASAPAKAGAGSAGQLRLDFALFKRNHPKAVLEGSEDAPQTAKLTDGFLAITPKVAAKVAAAIPSK